MIDLIVIVVAALIGLLINSVGTFRGPEGLVGVFLIAACVVVAAVAGVLSTWLPFCRFIGEFALFFGGSLYFTENVGR